jgi:hypothetical protein
MVNCLLCEVVVADVSGDETGRGLWQGENPPLEVRS